MSSDDIEDTSAPLVEHLAELRKRLIWSALSFVAAMFAVFPVWNPVFNFLTWPVCGALADRGQDCGLVLIKLQEGFFVAIKIAMFGGLFLSFPIIAYQLWRFVAPGLYKSEKRAFLPFLIASPAMFLLGAAFAFFVVIPIAFSFFLGFQQIGTPGVAIPTDGSVTPHVAGITFQGSVEEYLGLTMKFVVAFGLCFQLPVLLVLMGASGLITADSLVRMRKYAVVAILILSAVATPPDVMSQVILFAAVYPLYEISIYLIRRIERKKEAVLRAEGLWFEDEPEAAAPATPPQEESRG